MVFFGCVLLFSSVTQLLCKQNILNNAEFSSSVSFERFIGLIGLIIFVMIFIDFQYLPCCFSYDLSLYHYLYLIFVIHFDPFLNIVIDLVIDLVLDMNICTYLKNFPQIFRSINYLCVQNNKNIHKFIYRTFFPTRLCSCLYHRQHWIVTVVFW